MTQIELNKLPPIYREIMENFTVPLNPDVDLVSMLNVINAKLAHMATAKRIMVRPIPEEKPSIVNYYALNFISSGGGKDKLVREIDQYLLKKFKEFFALKTAFSQAEKDEAKEQVKENRKAQKGKEAKHGSDAF